MSETDVWCVATTSATAQVMSSYGLKRVFLLADMVGSPGIAKVIDVHRRVELWARRAECLLAERLLPGWSGRGQARARGEFGLVTAATLGTAAKMVTAFNELVTGLCPDVVATTSQVNSFACAAVLAGHRAGATSYFIQHGLMTHDPREAAAVHQHYLVWGEWDRRRRIALGLSGADVEVIGPVGLETTGAGQSPQAVPPRRSAGFRILFLPGRTGGAWVSHQSAARHLQIVTEAVARLSGTELIIKPHPSDHSPIFDQSAAAGQATVLRTEGPSELIADADVVIVSVTSSGLDACALDRPTVVVKADGDRVFPHYETHGAVLFASSGDELVRQLTTLRYDPIVREDLRQRRRQMLEDLLNGVRPGAATRAAAAIVNGASERFAARGRGAR